MTSWHFYAPFAALRDSVRLQKHLHRHGGVARRRTYLDYVREGDTLVVTRIDRLARSVLDLQTPSRQHHTAKLNWLID